MIPYRIVDLLRHGEVQGGPCFRGWQDDPLSPDGWAQLEAAIADVPPRPRAGTAVPRQVDAFAEGVQQQPVKGVVSAQAAGGADAACLVRPIPQQRPSREAEISPGSTDEQLPWDRILCSPAQRCAAFAQFLGQRTGIPVEARDAFRERGFGVWEGKRADQLPGAELARFWTDPAGYDPPDAEPFALFRQRVAEGWRELTEGEGEHTLLITHGGVIRVILGEVLGLPDDRLILIEVPPACRTRVRLPREGGKPSLIAHGSSGS